MGKSIYIPQYHLLDNSGNPVQFNFVYFGNKKQNYDFEKPHRHNFYEVLVFYKGGGTHDIDFTTYNARDRSIHFVASENVHLVLRGKKSSGCSLLMANDYISKDIISQLPFSKTNPILKLTKDDFTLISKLIESIKKEHAKKQIGYEAIIKAYVYTFMLHLQRAYRKQHPKEQEKNTAPELITQFLKLVGEHYLNHFKVEQYAEKLNVSAKHLIEFCKSHTGKTPLAHIRESMIAEAKKLLFNTPLSVKEIAYQLNFDEPANFSKYFKTATNYTPLEYREGIR